MTKQIINTNSPDDLINVGLNANDNRGDPLRSAFIKINDAIDKIDSNFTELYASSGGGNTDLGNYTFTGNDLSIDNDGTLHIAAQSSTAINLTIDNITNSDPCEVFASPDAGLLWDAIGEGYKVLISNITTMTELNGNSYYVQNASSTSFYLYTDPSFTQSVDSTSFTDYSSSPSQTSTNAYGTGGNQLKGSLIINPSLNSVQPGWTVSGTGINGTQAVTSVAQDGDFWLITVSITGNSFSPGVAYTFNGPVTDGGGAVVTSATAGSVVLSGGESPTTGAGIQGNLSLNGENVYVVANYNGWTFGPDGSLTVPGIITRPVDDTLILVTEGSNGNSASVSVNGELGKLLLRTDDGDTTNTWEFGINGNLTLPVGGVIKNSDGTTYGGSSGTSSVTTGTTPPISPNIGDLWYDTNDGRMYVYYDNTWIDASPVDGAGISSTNELVNGAHTVSLSSVGLTAFPAISNESLFIQASELGSANASIGISAKNNVIVTADILDTAKQWTFGTDGDLQIPEGGIVKDYLGNNIVPSNLSNFVNDLEIDANDLTGTTINSGITNSSLTSVGTLTSLTSSGVVHITNTEDSTNADSGALQVDGGAHITKNLIAEGTIYAGIDAYSEVLTNPLIVASAPSGVEGGYSQAAILNNTAEASGDFQVMVDGYDINGPAGDTGWADIGMSGSNFSDPRYTITQPQDGYVFVSALDGGTGSGNLVLGTDSTGANNDIVFATGGFLVENEKMRISNADGSLTIAGEIKSQAGTGDVVIEANDGTVRTWTFSSDGVLNLPATVGDIKKGGVSVLGGGTYTLPTASDTTLGGVKVDGSTIIINGSGVISSTVVGAVTLKGTWNASTNVPELSSSLPSGVQLGWQYLVSVTGTRDIGDGSQTYTAGDIVMYDGVKWTDIPGAAGSVASFNTRTGAITLTSGDVTTALGFTPYNATNPSGYITSSDNITGNAATATKLASSVNINGVAFDGSGSITVTAAASTLSGNALNSGVTQSSLTSVGTLTNLTVTNTINGSITGAAGSAPAGSLTGSTLASGVTSSSLTSVGTLTDLTVTNTISGTVQDGVVTTGTYANPSWITSLDASKLSGSTLASGVTASSLTSVGTLTGLTTSGTLTRSGNISSAAWNTAGIGLKLPAATYTDTTSATTQGSSYTHVIGVPTLAFSSATSISQAVNLYIGGDPIAGTNATVNAGTSYSLYVAGKSNFIGAVRFNGAIQSGGGASIMSLSNSSANVTAGTVSTAYNNGALVVTGGVGISGAVFTNSNITAAGYVAQTGLPAFRVYGVGSTTITVNTILTSTHYSVDYQQGGTNLATSTGIFTAPVGGLYQINIVGRAYSNAGVASQLAVIKNYDTTPFVMCMVEWAANTTVNHVGASTVARLAAGSTLVLKVLLGSVQFDSNDNWSVVFLG